MSNQKEFVQSSDTFLECDSIVQRIDTQLTEANIKHSLIVGGSLAYSDRQKADNIKDVDILLVIEGLDELERIYQDASILTRCGFRTGDVGFLPKKDLNILKQNQPHILARVSGDIIGMKTTLNIVTLNSLQRFFNTAYQNSFSKISHGKKVDIVERKTFGGQTVHIPLNCQDISRQYQDNELHYLIPDQNFYVTLENNVVPGMLADFILTGRVSEAADYFNLKTFQMELRKRYVKAILYWLPDEFWSLSSEEKIKRIKNIQWCKGFSRYERFSDQYGNRLSHLLEEEAMHVLDRYSSFYPPRKRVFRYEKTAVIYP